MNWYSILYWFTRLDSIKEFLLWSGLFLLFVIPIIVYFFALDKWRYTKTHVRITVISIIVGLCLLLLNVFIPTKKDAAIIIYWKAIEKDTTIRLKTLILKVKDDAFITKQELRDRILYEIKNSNTEDALNMLKDSDIQKILRE